MSTCATALRLPPSPASVRRARDWLRGVMADGPRLRDAQIVVSELVTNGMLHAGADADGRDIELRWCAGPRGRLRVEVIDFGPGFDLALPRVQPPAGQPHGRGLLVVDRLVDRWGVLDDPAGVWFELDGDRL